MNDYLWDKSGRDPGIEKLEGLLRPLAFREVRPPAAAPRFKLWIVGLAAAALFVMSGLQLAKAPPPGPTYTVAKTATMESCSAGPSQWVAWGGCERRIDLNGIGTVTADADAQVRVIRISDDQHRLRLERGTIHASIAGHVKPRLFQVETPTTTCIDLGCKYSLTVTPEGDTRVVVETGRVAFRDGDREVFVPEGAACTARRSGAGTPAFLDAPVEVARLADRLDCVSWSDRPALAVELASTITRPQEALILWHLVQDRDGNVAATAADKLISLSGLPPEVTRESTLRHDAATMQAWKSHLFPRWDW